MTQLGKCLLFYLKYSTEMERLYVEENFDGFPDDEALRKRINHVGDIACKDAAELLELCSEVIEEYFGSVAEIRRVRRKLDETWSSSFRIKPKNGTGREFWLGVYIDLTQRSLLPWVLSRGGRRAGDEMKRILQDSVAAVKLGTESGTVHLKGIRIPVPECLDDDVPAGEIIAEVRQTFAPFTSDHIQAISAIAAKHNGESE